MSKFIKVTAIGDAESKIEHRINLDSIESFKDGNVRLKQGVNISIIESAEEIEAQLLRDEFAVSAMNGILANPSVDNLEASSVAHDAYIFADAMLKEKSK